MKDKILDVDTRNALGEFLLALLPTPEDRISTAMFLINETRYICNISLDDMLRTIKDCIEAVEELEEKEEEDD